MSPPVGLFAPKVTLCVVPAIFHTTVAPVAIVTVAGAKEVPDVVTTLPDGVGVDGVVGGGAAGVVVVPPEAVDGAAAGSTAAPPPPQAITPIANGIIPRRTAELFRSKAFKVHSPMSVLR